MKKIFLILLLLLACSAGYAKAPAYLTKEEISTGAAFLPLPPQPSEAAFYNDWQRYQWGKTQRDTERGKQAIEDANDRLTYLAQIYSEPFGLQISPENTPEIWALLERTFATAVICKDEAKKRTMRNRPFVQFNEPTPVPKDEITLKHNSSYPSGHTTQGWAVALALAQINPARQDAILQRGFEYGESRVIVGFHFQSDVDAARLLTSILLNRLNANDEFRQQLDKAKTEFWQKTQANSS
ncbi:MAG: phosphatase PAP2 family protein [Alphaproteobacteria bacterium]|nr:phosphatase PAP2 family protein [Alphaproteobacteria bacterium]